MAFHLYSPPQYDTLTQTISFNTRETLCPIKIASYKQALKRRAKAMQPKHKGTDRWDQPRVLGSRCRRILREQDMPNAPTKPPLSGYVCFVVQMTTKV